MEALNEIGKPLKGAKILILGLAYKANVDDNRESPSFQLMEKLEAKGAVVSYNDPYIPEIARNREFPHYAGKKSVPVVDSYDAILIATPHDEYKSLDFSGFKCPIIDTRNIARTGQVTKAHLGTEVFCPVPCPCTPASRISPKRSRLSPRRYCCGAFSADGCLS